MNSFEQTLALSGPDALQSFDERREELAEDVVAASCFHGDFVLSSGAPTTYWFDKHRFASKPTILRRLASLLAERVPARVDRLVARESGATTIVVALSLESGIPFAILQDAANSGGSQVRGEIHPGERVVLVEDVVSTGRSAAAAVTVLRAIGAELVGVLAAIDRAEGADDVLAAAGTTLDPLVTADAAGMESYGKGE